MSEQWFSKASLKNKAKRTGRGMPYVQDVLSHAEQVGNRRYLMDRETFMELRRKWSHEFAESHERVVDLRLAEQRAEVCEQCPENKGVTRTRRGWPVHRVKCKACGCGGLSLIKGECPKNQWPEPTGDK